VCDGESGLIQEVSVRRGEDVDTVEGKMGHE
jgi:hypothetical protein